MNKSELKAYSLLDSGGCRKLEQVGPVRIIRPALNAFWQPTLPASEWAKADAEFKRESGGGGGIWTYPPDEEEEETPPPEAEVVEEEWENEQVLKRSPAGNLLRCASGHLLLGDLTCDPGPHFLLRIRGGGCAGHAQCALWTFSAGRPSFEAEPPAEEDEEDTAEEVLVCCRHIFLQAGKFSVFLRWQGGHYDHRTVREMRITLFGIDLGWKVYPLDWITAADVLITPEGEVYVNGIRGTI